MFSILDNKHNILTIFYGENLQKYLKVSTYVIYATSYSLWKYVNIEFCKILITSNGDLLIYAATVQLKKNIQSIFSFLSFSGCILPFSCMKFIVFSYSHLFTNNENISHLHMCYLLQNWVVYNELVVTKFISAQPNIKYYFMHNSTCDMAYFLFYASQC